jgi:TPR repeat protein
MYANSRGVAKDETESVKGYRKSADQGNAIAQTNLGVMYANGRGVAKNETESVKGYRKAADQGNAIALTRLGYPIS